MIKLCRIMVWISVDITVASLGMLVWQVASAGKWWWAISAAAWGICIFNWRNLLAQQVRYRDSRASFTNYYIDR